MPANLLVSDSLFLAENLSTCIHHFYGVGFIGTHLRGVSKGRWQPNEAASQKWQRIAWRIEDSRPGKSTYGGIYVAETALLCYYNDPLYTVCVPRGTERKLWPTTATTNSEPTVANGAAKTGLKCIFCFHGETVQSWISRGSTDLRVSSETLWRGESGKLFTCHLSQAIQMNILRRNFTSKSWWFPGQIWHCCS